MTLTHKSYSAELHRLSPAGSHEDCLLQDRAQLGQPVSRVNTGRLAAFGDRTMKLEKSQQDKRDEINRRALKDERIRWAMRAARHATGNRAKRRAAMARAKKGN